MKNNGNKQFSHAQVFLKAQSYHIENGTERISGFQYGIEFEIQSQKGKFGVIA